jgi:hypothetical protein
LARVKFGVEDVHAASVMAMALAARVVSTLRERGTVRVVPGIGDPVGAVDDARRDAEAGETSRRYESAPGVVEARATRRSPPRHGVIRRIFT